MIREMTQSPNHPAQKYLELRAKNMQFFRQRYPGIHQYFSNYQMQHAKVDILPEADEVDLLVEGKRLYGGRAKEYAKREVATFLSAYDYGVKIKTIAPLGKDTYRNQRLFARSISTLYEHFYSQDRPFSGYKLQDFFPLVVFMGVGLGVHVRVMTAIRDIRHAVVFENDMDSFSASLYSVDWAALITPFLEDDSRSFSFILLPNAKDEAHLYAGIWNHLIKMCPIFPLTTLFYNHLGNPVFDRVTDKVNSDIYVHLFSFGNFDDEVNQLNNSHHNLKRGIPLIGAPSKQYSNMPVCIVGSGPSLEVRSEELRSIQDKAIIISCGTAIGALHKLGITPDIQVELESDYIAYTLHSQIDDVDYLKSIKLVAAAQLNPLMFDLFGESRLFFKNDGSLAHWFSRLTQAIPNATPTCTNAALAIALHFGFKKILLFGLDYGFPSRDEHHAKGSVYFNENEKGNSSILSETLIKTEAAAGGMTLTTKFLYTAKRRTENLLSAMAGEPVINCSNGSKIEGTLWTDNVASMLESGNLKYSKAEVISAWFDESNEVVGRDSIGQARANIQADFDRLHSEFTDLISAYNIESLVGFSDFCSRVISILNSLEAENIGLFYFIRGSIWHYLFAGYSHVYSIDKTLDQSNYICFWRDNFKRFLDLSKDEVHSVLNNPSSIYDDEMVANTIGLPTSKDRLAAIPELKWNYMAASVHEGHLFIDDCQWEYANYCFNGDRFVRYEDL